jgi:hypothetical protein
LRHEPNEEKSSGGGGGGGGADVESTSRSASGGGTPDEPGLHVGNSAYVRRVPRGAFASGKTLLSLFLLSLSLSR